MPSKKKIMKSLKFKNGLKSSIALLEIKLCAFLFDTSVFICAHVVMSLNKL